MSTCHLKMFPNTYIMISGPSSSFPAAGLYLTSPSSIRTPQFNRRQETDIQQLQLSELLGNPHVFRLWNQYQGATERLLQESEEQKKLLLQINMLAAETHALRAELAELRYCHNQQG